MHLKHLLLLPLFIFLTGLESYCQTAETGMASYYHDQLEGRPTASGEPYKATEMTAAHPSLPFNTKIRVTNLANGRKVILRVNDRGPFTKGRILDVSKAAAKELGFLEKGVTKVKVEILDKT